MTTHRHGASTYRSAIHRDGPFGRRYYTNIYAIDAKSIGRIKFGKTLNVAKRFSGLCTSAPCELVLIGHCLLPDDAEIAIFEYLKADRLHGEWFAATEAVRGMAALVASRDIERLAQELELTWMIREERPTGVSWGARY
jgi:hypothetical protein